MTNLLYLVHRLPYPPNKGDKVRSYHLLKHLAKNHRVYLGSFIDDPEDERYLECLPQYCAEMHVARLKPVLARILSLKGLLNNQALTVPYYQNTGLKNWVDKVIKENKIEAAVVFSSAMAAYVENIQNIKKIIDFVDVDSAKWSQYAKNHRWPLSWLYKREGKMLLSFERRVAIQAEKSFFVTENEKNLFCQLAPECSNKVSAMCNGVDSDFFSPEHEFNTPYNKEEIPIVFTGAMDYWPNIDAVRWFSAEIFPKLKSEWSNLHFYIVGRNPDQSVLRLAKENEIVVTGTVPDVRPYLRHASVVVAPLRLARGIQNKILEAMAIGRPVVASEECSTAVDAVAGRDFLTATTVSDYVQKIDELLRKRKFAEDIGICARKQVVAKYSWDAHLTNIDRHLGFDA